MTPALVVIDLQNDFVSAKGLLGIKHIPVEPLLSTLEGICSLFKEENWPIVAVRSEYPDASPEEVVDDISTRTHRGKRKFCAPGTAGAEFPRLFIDFLAKYSQSPVITKTRYSAFHDTNLHEYVQSQGVGDGPLYFAGVTANKCVLTSIIAAFRLDFKIFAIREAIGATESQLASNAFKTIDRFYGSVVSATDLTNDAISKHVEHRRRILYWVCGSIPSWRVMICLTEKGLPYQRKRLHVMTKPKDTRLPDFQSINERGKTPTLIDHDGTKMVESMAILEDLEEDYPSPALMPPVTDKVNRKLTRRRFHDSENLHNVFEDIELLFEPTWLEPHNKERVLAAYNNTHKELSFWETYLQSTPFVAGSTFSLADIAFYPNLAYLVHRGMDLEREIFPKLANYCERVGKLPSVIDARPVGYEKVAKNNLFRKLYKVLDDERR